MYRPKYIKSPTVSFKKPAGNEIHDQHEQYTLTYGMMTGILQSVVEKYDFCHHLFFLDCNAVYQRHILYIDEITCDIVSIYTCHDLLEMIETCDVGVCFPFFRTACVRQTDFHAFSFHRLGRATCSSFIWICGTLCALTNGTFQRTRNRN